MNQSRNLLTETQVTMFEKFQKMLNISQSEIKKQFEITRHLIEKTKKNLRNAKKTLRNVFKK